MKTRIITGVIAAALFIPFVVYGNVPFTILVYALATVGFYELLKMKKMQLFSVPGMFGLVTVYALLMPKGWEESVQEAISYSKFELLFIGVILLLVYSVIVKNRFTFDDVAFVVLGSLYIGIGFHYLIVTRGAGLEYIIFALLVVWVTDSGAYFTGRKFGKNKLWPEISPNKTIEGFVGGIVLAVIGAIIMQFIAPFEHISLGLLIFITIVASMFGQMGDLVESAIKRHYGVKDSGNILPGHGGILDRFDSLLFVLPLLSLLHFVS